MKRLLMLLLTLVLLWGCTAEPEQSAIRIAPLEEVRDFGGFTAQLPGEQEAQARAMVESALAQYPRSLLEQLGPVEILLAGELTGYDRFEGGSYAGFTQRLEDGWRVVISAPAAHPGTVHHELGHILDSVLTAAGRLPEEEWSSRNPPGFRYGTGDWEAYSDFFADAYAMTDLTEDRAAVFEAAVMGGEGVFDGKSPLWLKLYTFSEAIRAHFNTDGWPSTTVWELALR